MFYACQEVLLVCPDHQFPPLNHSNQQEPKNAKVHHQQVDAKLELNFDYLLEYLIFKDPKCQYKTLYEDISYFDVQLFAEFLK